MRALAPALAVIGFAGCDRVVGLDPITPRPPDASTVVPGPIAFVQVTSCVPPSGTQVDCPFASPLHDGNLAVVFAGWDTTSGTIAVTDTNGNHYVQAGPTLARQSMWYATDIVGGSNTVTVMFGGVTSFPDIRIVEYSGIAGTNVLDGAAGQSGIGTAIDSGSFATVHGYDLIVAGTDVADQCAAGSGFEQRTITVPDGDIVEDRVVTVPGTYSAAATQTGPDAWSISVAAFRGVLDAPP